MKKIVFQVGLKEEIFLITDSEFKEAVSCWNNNNDYYCQRLEALLPKKYRFVRTPINEIGFEVFVYLTKNKEVAKLFKKNDKFYKEIDKGSGIVKVEVEVAKDFKKKLISQEDYYKQRDIAPLKMALIKDRNS